MSLRKKNLVSCFAVFLPLLIFGAFGLSEAAIANSNQYQLHVQEDLITLSAESVPLAEVFQDISKAADIQLKIRRNGDTPVTISKMNVRIQELLKALSISYAYIEEREKDGSVLKSLYLMPSGNTDSVRGSMGPGATASRPAAARNGSLQGSSPSPGDDQPKISRQDMSKQAERVPNELLIRFSSQATPEQIAALNDNLSASVVKQIPQLRIYRLSFPAGTDLDAIRQRYAESSLTEMVEPNYIARIPAQTLNDPNSGEQWGLQKAMVPEAWSITEGSPNVVIAVVDTGVDANHPDLTHQLKSGYDVLTGTSGIPADDNGHGTQMAAIIAAEGNNALGIAGVSWKSKILPIKALDSNGVGTYTDIIEGMIYAADHGAQIINLSLGGYAYSEMLKEAVQYAHDKNVVIVAGAGNDGKNQPIYPAALPNVLAVSATGAEDEKWSYANFGNFVDLAAPGVGILSATMGGGYGYGSGTSQAAAFVSGVAALVKAANATFSNTQIEQRLQASADDLGASGRDVIFGAGRVNALKAVSSGR